VRRSLRPHCRQPDLAAHRHQQRYRHLVGATLSSPTAAWGYQSGRLDLFVAGTGGGLYQKVFAGGRWSGWYRLDAILPASGRLAAAARSGRVIVYASAGGVTSYKQYVGAWVC
jgi:hypothetical protein